MLKFAAIWPRLCHSNGNGFTAVDRVGGRGFIDNEVEAAGIGTMSQFDISASGTLLGDRPFHMHFKFSDMLGPSWCGSIQLGVDRLSSSTRASNVRLSVSQH